MTSRSVPLPNFQELSCVDILHFQEALQRSRDLDDKIIYELNVALPTSSFSKGVDAHGSCEVVYNKLRGLYDERDRALRRCINETMKRVTELKQKQDEDLPPSHALRSANNNLRLYRNEINIEEVVKDRSMKVFYERCRNVFTPPADGTS